MDQKQTEKKGQTRPGLNILLVIIISQISLVLILSLFWILLRNFLELSSLVTHILLAVAGVGWLVATAFLLYQRLLRPINLINNHIEAIGKSDLKYRTKQGLPGEFANIGTKLNNLSGRLQEFVSHSQAETEVIVAEANRLRNVLNSINDGVFALDRGNRIMLFNKAASVITGYKIEEAAGKPLNHIVPLFRGNQTVVHEWLRANEGLARAEEQWEALTLQTSTGKQRSVDVYALYQGEDPNGIRTLITFHDRTAAQEIEDMKVDFVALAAHELRTPVTVIKGYLEILTNELFSQLNPEQIEIITKLNVSTGQLSSFINNILNVSRIEHGSLNLNFEKIDWKSLLTDTCQSLYQKALAQDKRLELLIEENLPPVAVDANSIKEVIINLVDNAIKYSPREGRIVIKAKNKQGSVETLIEDNGIGIPTTSLDKLFTKFYRSHRTRTSHPGTGLGLYMSKGIVEAHGGTIWVQSAEGIGSTFGFSLPQYKVVADKVKTNDNEKGIIRGVHGWIKNHTLYRG
jgi:PAS domain S-box-containing protein